MLVGTGSDTCTGTTVTRSRSGYSGRIVDGISLTSFFIPSQTQLVNKDGSWVYAQFHLLSDQGIKTLTNEEAAKKSPDYGQADLSVFLGSWRSVTRF
jgi:catalase